MANDLLEFSKTSDIEPQLVVTNWSPCFGWPQNDSPPLMEYLNTTMGTKMTKVCKGWKEVLQEVGVSNVVGETWVKQLLRLSQTLAERRRGEQIVVLVDEIRYKTMMDKLGDESFPDSLRLILVLNPTLTADKPP